MLIRALMVLLVFLNLGVAGWWLIHVEPVRPAPAQPEGVAILQLAPPRTTKPAVPAAEQVPTSMPVPPPVSEPAPQVTSVSPPVALPPAKTVVAPAPAVCLALGPFANQAAARTALGQLQPAPRTFSLRSETPPAKSYSVLLPPLADRAAAQAMVERIAAAGFNDFLIISSGEAVNGVALGRYGSRESAERRQADLKAAGFPAQIQPVGQAGATQWWLDVATAVTDTDLVRRQAQAVRAVPRDCG